MWKIRCFIALTRALLAQHAAYPQCKSTDINRSRRRGYGERMLGLVLLPYRCESCDFRFFRLRWARPLRRSADSEELPSAHVNAPPHSLLPPKPEPPVAEETVHSGA